jgi:TonB-dependent receptor
MSRPDIGLLKNYTTFNITLPNGSDASDPLFVRDGGGNIIGANAVYSASSYNPRLKPMTATMFDLSVESYFADVGQFSVAAFYKRFQNYIQHGSRFVEFTNGGVTNTIEERAPLNGKGGKVYGIEGSFQRFFDFLPGALSGLGMQVNATYVKNKGITNSGLKNQSAGPGGSQGQPGSSGTVLTVNSLEGLSKYAFNVVGMYEKYGLALRLAYNWRSKFLVTAVDCCTYLPAWQMSAGFLDGSVRYAINDHIELSVQGSNLLNTETRLKQQVTGVEDGAILVPNSWFQNGRRFQFGVRAKF